MSHFPFGLPAATITYLLLYLITLAVHFVFMGYVLAGAGYVAVSALRGRSDESADESVIAPILRDWLPFALGAAITAGVAPLLFLQVLYKEHFYTANLLLFYRWMAVVPVLIAGFYLLYLQKSKTASRLPVAVRRAIPIAAFACFAFTAYSWTENHLLSMDGAVWTEMYAAGQHSYFSAHSLPRTIFWLALAVPCMCAIASWQVRRQAHGDQPVEPDEVASAARTAARPAARQLALIAALGVVASAVAGWFYSSVIGAEAFAAVGATVGSISAYWGLIALGGLVQLAAWGWVWWVGGLDSRALSAASVGALATIVGVLAVREAVRATAVDIIALRPIHERVAEAGGLVVFLVFALAAVALIAWCFWMTARALRDRAP